MNTAMRVVLVVMAVLAVGLAATGSADAKGRGRRPVSARVATQRQVCESGGGTLTAESYETLAYTSCSGGDYDGWSCTLTPSSQDCSYKRVVPGDIGPIGGVLVVDTVEVADEPVIDRAPVVVETAGIVDEPAAEAAPLPGGIARNPIGEQVSDTAETADAASDE